MSHTLEELPDAERAEVLDVVKRYPIIMELMQGTRRRFENGPNAGPGKGETGATNTL